MQENLSDVFGSENSTVFELIRYCIYGVFIYLNIDLDIVTILSYLMMGDMAAGVIKSIRLGNKVSLSVFLWGLAIKMLLVGIPMVVALMGKGLQMDFVWAVSMAVKVLIVNEGFSIFANILSIKQKKDVENFDFVTWFIELLKDFFINKFKMYFDNSKK